jgi:D-psicose/D-tagatose/L-ribulose 3-epimerase
MASRKTGFKYSIAVTQEKVSTAAPILFRGDIFQTIRDAKSLGYDAVELQLRDAPRIDGAALAQFCADNDFAISGLATGLECSLNHLTMISDNLRTRRKMREKLREHVDLAQQLGCMVIIGCVRGNIPDGRDEAKYMKRFVSGLAELVEYAAQKNVIVVLEAINSYVNNYLNTVCETCNLVSELGYENLKLHVDTHHMNIEDYDPIDGLKYCGKYIGYVHVAEINRMYPGAGRLDFKTYLATLSQIGYEGYVALECIPKPTAFAAAKKGIDYLKELEKTI